MIAESHHAGRTYSATRRGTYSDAPVGAPDAGEDSPGRSGETAAQGAGACWWTSQRSALLYLLPVYLGVPRGTACICSALEVATGPLPRRTLLRPRPAACQQGQRYASQLAGNTSRTRTTWRRSPWRITSVTEVPKLRRYSISQLFPFYNVLRRDVSPVDPRMFLPNNVPIHKQWARRWHQIHSRMAVVLRSAASPNRARESSCIQTDTWPIGPSRMTCGHRPAPASRWQSLMALSDVEAHSHHPNRGVEDALKLGWPHTPHQP